MLSHRQLSQSMRDNFKLALHFDPRPLTQLTIHQLFNLKPLLIITLNLHKKRNVAGVDRSLNA